MPLHRVERTVRVDPPSHRQTIRQEETARLISDFTDCINDRLSRLPGESTITSALPCGLMWFNRLHIHLNDGRPKIEVSATKDNMRHIVSRRKAHVFMVPEASAKTPAVSHTLIETVTLEDIDARARLFDVMTRPPTTRLTGSTNCCRRSMLSKTERSH